MATIIDSYSESNYASVGIIYGGFAADSKEGQSFTGDGGILSSAKFLLRKNGSPTGNAVVKIYAETHETAFGTDSVPTGSALATSGTYETSNLTTENQLISFPFTGANKITLVDGTYYFVSFEFDGGDIGNRVYIGLDNASPTHNGNTAKYNEAGGGWISWDGADNCFYVYKDDFINPTGPFPTYLKRST
jgi:hypothetical protein